MAGVCCDCGVCVTVAVFRFGQHKTGCQRDSNGRRQTGSSLAEHLQQPPFPQILRKRYTTSAIPQNLFSSLIIIIGLFPVFHPGPFK